MPAGYEAVTTVRASAQFAPTSATQTTATNDVFAYGGAIGMTVVVSQSSVAATSAGGGTGVLVHTIQSKDPIGGIYTNTTGVITCTTAVPTSYTLQCYPGFATVVPTSAAVGKASYMVEPSWRIITTPNSSATTWTYSITAAYVPTAGTSS